VLQSLYQEGINWSEQLLLVPGLSDAARGDQLNNISYLARAAGMLARARSAAEGAITAHRRSQDQEGLAWALGNLAQILLTFGDYVSARALHEESTLIRRAISGPHTVAWGLIMQVIVELLLTDRAAAQADYYEALALSRANGDRFTEGGAHNYYALGLTLLGDLKAAPIAAQALELLSVPNYPWGVIIALEVLAGQAGMRGQHQKAGWFAGAARQVRQQHQIAGSAIYKVDYDRLLELARGTFDERAWNAAMQHGAELPREELIALAHHAI
jgi:tetratricopeptide (TPR) repeat protein